MFTDLWVGALWVFLWWWAAVLAADSACVDVDYCLTNEGFAGVIVVVGLWLCWFTGLGVWCIVG